MSQQIELVLNAVNKTEAAFKSMEKHLKQVEKNTKAAAAAAKKQNTAFADLTKKAAAFTAGFFATRKAIDFVTEALEKQAAQEAAVNSLNLALFNQGNYSKETSAALQKYASSLQDVSTYADETILQSQALLASFGNNEEQIKKLTPTILDFATATGRDLKGATEALLNAQKGETGELEKYIGKIDPAIKGTDRFNMVVERLNTAFGGSAQAATATYAGQMQQLKNAFGDAQEAVGKFVGSIFSMGDAAGTGIGFAKDLQHFFGVTLVKALGETRAAFSELLGWLVGRLGDLGEMLAKIPVIGKKIAGEWTSTFKQMEIDLQGHAILLREQAHNTAESAGAVEDFGRRSAIAGSSAQTLAAATEKAGKAAKDTAVEVWKLGDAVMTLPGAVDMTATAFEAWEYTIQSLPPAIDHTKAVFGDLTSQAIQGTVDWRTQLQDLAFQFSNMGGTAGEVLGQITTSIAGVATQVQKLTTAFGEGGLAGAAGLGGFLAKLTSGLGILGSAISLATTLGGVLKGIFGGKSEVSKVRDEFFGQFAEGFISVQKLLVGTAGQVEREDWVKQLFDAKTVEEFNRILEKVLATIGEIPNEVKVNTTYTSTGTPPANVPRDYAPDMAKGGIVVPFRPQNAAGGAIARARPGGSLFNVGEGGQTELIAPVKALLSEMKGAAIAAAGGGGPQVINLHLDGEVFARAMIRRNRAGQLPIRAASVRRN